jgi:uncharacterized membrane protein
MHLSQYHYLPMTPGFFAVLVGIFLVVIVLIQVGILRYAYMRLGLSSGAAMLLLFGSLIGSYFNIPIANLPGERVLSGQVVDFFGVQYVVPVVVNWPGTLIAVNIGGAVIPTLVSLYLVIKHRLWINGALAVAGVAIVVHWLATPVPGIGIAVPMFVPVVATVVVALLLSREYGARLAYVGGCLGTLIGADLSNLDKVQGLGAPIASIGGAGTFDGVFLTGILAVLLAGIYPWPRRNKAPSQIHIRS